MSPDLHAPARICRDECWCFCGSCATCKSLQPDPPRQMEDGTWVVNHACPPCDGNCNQGDDCSAEQGEPVSAWPFMLASGLGSLLLVLIGYALGWYFGGRR